MSDVRASCEISQSLPDHASIDDVARAIRLVTVAGGTVVTVTVSQPMALTLARLIERRNEAAAPHRGLAALRGGGRDQVFLLIALIWMVVAIWSRG